MIYSRRNSSKLILPPKVITMSKPADNPGFSGNRIFDIIFRLIITLLALFISTGLFADQRDIPNIIGTLSLDYDHADVVYTNIKLPHIPIRKYTSH